LTDMRVAALAYARFGFAIFPVSVDKTPLTPHGFKDATTDEAQIERWWDEFPDAGIGLPTGAATGVVVLDEDPRHGGRESLEALVSRHGPLPQSPVARTGGGGRHFWFRHPGGAFPSLAGFRPGLDTRGDGGYVVVPPSPHPSGTPYAWIADPSEAELRLPPPWLLAEMERRESAAGHRFEAGPGGRIPHGRHHEYIVQTAASLASRVAGISEADLLRSVSAAVRETIDDAASHEREMADAVRSAIGKYGRPAPAQSGSARPETGGGVGSGPVTSPVGTGGASPVTPAGTRAEAPAPPGLFKEVTARGGRGETTFVPVPYAFVEWFRGSERFVVPVERGTFSTGGNFELLRYEGGYYNGMARTFVRGRVEGAFRARAQASSDGFREEVVRGIAATPEVHRLRAGFNPPGLLCLENGILDTGTGTIAPHSPDVVFTWRMPVAYDPEARAPRFERFLEEVMPDERRRALLVDLMGYCLRRENPLQLFFVLVGDGANGKTTFGRVLAGLLGKDAVSTLSLQQVGSHRFAPAELEGRLLNLCDDLPYDRPLAATGVLKVLTGGGSMTVERKHQHPFELVFGGKLVSMANRMPPTEDDTYAFWRRAVVVPFEQVFPEDDPRRDPGLADKLLAELPGVLNIALAGLARVRSRREFDPDGMLADPREEWHRRADPVRAELLDAFEYCPGAFVTNDRLREWHVRLYESAGREPLSGEALGAAVGRVFPRSSPSKRRMVHGKLTWGRPGLREKVGLAGVGAIQGPDLTRYGGGLGPDAPKDGQSPARPIPREGQGSDRPGLAGGSPIVIGTAGEASVSNTNPPANPGNPGGSGPPPVPLNFEPSGPCSQVSDKRPRERHKNCPNCVTLEHHICLACPACTWELNHGDENL
jgi:P4 family phage/plasmid primase-like protien